MAKLITALLLSTLVVPVYAANIYKWTDKEGQVHYTRTPPPKSAQKTPVTGSAPKKAPGSETGLPSAITDPQKQLPATVAQSPEEQRRQKDCRSAQQDLQEMQRSDRVKEHGHEIEINEDERLRRLNELKEKIEEFCKPAKAHPAPQPVQKSVPQPVQRAVPQSVPPVTQQPRPQAIHRPTPTIVQQPLSQAIQKPLPPAKQIRTQQDRPTTELSPGQNLQTQPNQ